MQLLHIGSITLVITPLGSARSNQAPLPLTWAPFLDLPGLFKSVKPGAAAAGRDDAPHFGVSFSSDGSAQLLTIPPLGGVRFTLEPRELPPIVDFSVRMDSSLMVSEKIRDTENGTR